MEVVLAPVLALGRVHLHLLHHTPPAQALGPELGPKLARTQGLEQGQVRVETGMEGRDLVRDMAEVGAEEAVKVMAMEEATKEKIIAREGRIN